MNNLDNIIESLLFISGDAVDISDISSKLDASKKDILKAADRLKEKYSGESGIVILNFNNKLQLSTNSAYAKEVALVLNPIRERQLSKATLETVSIIAYKQPITRLEIEEIRGVSSDYAINILMEHNLIEIIGKKDSVGKPLLFGTTDEFLKRFNLSGLDELPNYEELLDRIKTINSSAETEDSLYIKYDIPTDKIVPEMSEKDISQTEFIHLKEQKHNREKLNELRKKREHLKELKTKNKDNILINKDNENELVFNINANSSDADIL